MERWEKSGQQFKTELEKQGFKVNLLFAKTADEQSKQVENAIKDKANCVVIGAVDSKTIGKALEKAKKNNIPIIAYDRLPMNTNAVSYYATFDNEGIGIAMGKYIVNKYNLKSGAGPYTIEFFQGADDDNNAHIINKGVMSVLKPYMDDGQLVVPSGQIDFKATNTPEWSPQNAAKRMEKLVAQYYGTRNLDIVLSASDSVTDGVIQGLMNAGYSGSWPFITGQDATKKNLAYVEQGKQGFTILKSADLINSKCIRMVKAVIDGSQLEINDVKTYNNGVITVPSYLCIPLIIDKNNIAQVH
nr:sugar-binding protein [Pectinatus sottacetonis]